MPVNCQWTGWTIGECSRTCGSGIRTKTREIKVQSSHGGETCNSGDRTTTESCNPNACPGKGICVCNLKSALIFYNKYNWENNPYSRLK